MQEQDKNSLFWRIMGDACAACVAVGLLCGLSARQVRAASSEAAALCGSSRDPLRVSVSGYRDTLRIVHSIARDDIENHRADGLKNVRPAGETASDREGAWRTLGLTNAHFLVEFNTESRLLRAADGRWCLFITDVSIKVGYPLQEILVPAEYPVGSCEYEAIVAHERQHVALNRKILASHMISFQRRAESALAEKSPLVVASRQTVQSMLSQTIGKTLDPLFEPFRREREQQNRRLDTAANYRQISARCDRW